MELRVLQYFLAVAREQSISKAADSLHLSQPTLSTQLKHMEEELGKQLLIRGTKGSRKVLLTDEGMILRKRAEEYAQHCSEKERQAMEAERAVTDATNELLLKNAATLKQGTIDIARESERGVVDIETLKKTNQELISTLDELNKIRADGKAKRAAAEQELGRIEGELRAKLLELNQ